MRIAFLPGVFPMLAETPVLNQITGLVARGHEVDVYGDRPKVEAPYHPSIDQLHLLERAHYRPDLPSRWFQRWAKGIRLASAARGNERRALLRAMNVLRFGTRAATGRLVLQTAQFLPPRTYDIIQAGFGEQGLKALRMKRVGAVQGRLVTAFRGADLTRFVRRRGGAVYRGLFREGDLFLPVCHSFAARLRSLGCPADKIEVHRTGIDLARFRFEPRPPGLRLRLISVGRLTEKKGLGDAIIAASMLASDGVDFTYTIIGDGPLRSRLEAAMRDAGLASRLFFAGSLEQSAVQAELAKADILLAPSVTAPDGDEEGIPNVLKEAMASGLPVVSTRHSGIPELVEDRVTGLLAAEHDPEGLASCIRWLGDHPDSWRPIQLAARRRIEEEYDIERLNDKLVVLYRGLVERSR
jgi:colanic acid/amylovoran biosynthesis glycosyltransferase